MDSEVKSFIIEAPNEKICVDEAKALRAVAVGEDANICKNGSVESGIQVYPVESTDFLETDGYVAKELDKDVVIGDNLCHMRQSTGVT